MSVPETTMVKTEIPLPIKTAFDSIAERLGDSSESLMIEALTEYIEREGVLPPNAEFVVDALRRDRPELEKLGVMHISLFGSVARGQESLGSDIDLLIDFFPKEKPDIFQLEDIRLRIQATLNTQSRLGLVLRRSMDSKIKETVLAEERKIF